MSLTDFHIKHYRSVRDAWLKLPRITVIVGPNGAGKSNLYRGLYLTSATASGQLARSVAEEGGMESILWSGDYGLGDKGQVSLSVKINEVQYDLGLGVMGDRYGLFEKDLQIKHERVYVFKKGVKSRILNRGMAVFEARDVKGVTSDYTMRVSSNESVLTGLREPHRYPELSQLRQELLGWRFYHHFRTDKDSPLRRPQFPIATPIMSHDGSDLISAIASIQQWGDWEKFQQSLDEAFPGARLNLEMTHSGLRMSVQYPGLQRALDASELSDGTLQYLCLLCALYSLIAPSLLVLNEPETSIHPDLFEPLAQLLVQASQESQIWITTHSTELSDYILDLSGYSPLAIEKKEGETRLVGVKLGIHPDDDDDDEEDALDEEDDDGTLEAMVSGKRKAADESKIRSRTKTVDNAAKIDPENSAAAAKLANLRKKLQGSQTQE